MAGKSYGMGSPKSMAKPGKRRIAKAKRAMVEKRVGASAAKGINSRLFVPPKLYKNQYGFNPPAPGYFAGKKAK